ncbi:hypothetical protein DESUT3_25500 [Desulfuromonas versatilis]|uniref:PTS sugar transporter subunit IIC n=1 Tax=Desulfuromonas versatilis TaxID=2802975 RepID=A0ABM8HXN7_9BACT|nr:PTS sugar transporter subunit IIC [Desulfuromonas versatilis]BCR05481.1 hypothetical protein DESUT3_25500 [Desulfuromonas versatilis]
MPGVDFLIAGLVSVFVGLDRTAVLQVMVSRPIVAAPLTGLLLGEPAVGLQVGALVELLWLGRLPVGAAIPPDDTQVAVGATALAIVFQGPLGLTGLAPSVLCTLVALPLGRIGQAFDRWARTRNGELLKRALDSLDAGQLEAAEKSHLLGLSHFALASLATYLVIIGAGSAVLLLFGSPLLQLVDPAKGWLWMVFPLVGTAVILGTINVSRSLTLFGASFTSAFLMLWLL